MSTKRKIQRANGAAGPTTNNAAAIQEKKALAYDILARIQQLNAMLQTVNQQIAELSGQAPPKPIEGAERPTEAPTGKEAMPS